ncbi:MAG TPA: hypothetical protein VGI39_27360 [Polyangiaceae bacterium]|jgi:hypothetical protein
MTVRARWSLGVRATAFSALALLGCQSILGINSDRPLVEGGVDEASTGLPDVNAPPPDGTMSGDDGGADTTPPPPPPEAGPVPDASDGGPPPVDSGPGITFANPFQLDAAAIFNANSVATTTVGGMDLTPMDGVGTNDNNTFPTVSAASALSGTGVGLPDDAKFSGDGVSIPSFQLAWSNAMNGPNSLVLSATKGTMFTFEVAQQPYHQVQVYVTSAGGASTLNVTLNYADGTQSSFAPNVPDWCVGNPAGGQYVLASVDRVTNGDTAGAALNTQYLCHIYAVDLNPDTGRALKSVMFWDTGTAPTNFVFYGATAW